MLRFEPTSVNFARYASTAIKSLDSTWVHMYCQEDSLEKLEKIHFPNFVLTTKRCFREQNQFVFLGLSHGKSLENLTFFCYNDKSTVLLK
jgi:hypothetical protein